MEKNTKNRVSAIVRCPKTYEKREFLKETLDWAEKVIKDTDEYLDKIMKFSDNSEKKLYLSETILTSLYISDQEECLASFANDMKQNYAELVMLLMNIVKMKVEAEKIYSATELAKLIDPQDEKSVGYEWEEEEFFEELKALKAKSAQNVTH